MKPNHITKTEAKRILAKIGESIRYFKPIKDPDSFCNPCSFLNGYVLRQVSPIWPNKAEAEVYAIDFAKQLGIPVPKILYWDKEYILMEKAPGKNLAKIWENLDRKQKRQYMKQVISYLEFMQKRRSDLIGSLYADGVGKSVDLQKGPYSSFRDFFLDDYDKRINDVKLPVKSKFKSFRSSMSSYNPKVNFVFSHGDLSLKNIFVKNGKITCIIDWEWAGFYPQITDYLEIREWCDKDLIEKSKLRTKYPKKLMNYISISSSAMCFACYKSWNIKDEKKYLQDLEFSLLKLLS
jgi:serine/threonine protein kinase